MIGFLVIAGAAVASFVGGIFAIRARKKADPGAPPYAPHGVPLRWPSKSMPLFLAVDPAAKSWLGPTEAACAWWRQQLGEQLALCAGILEPALTGGSVVAISEHDLEDPHGRTTFRERSGVIVSATMMLPSLTPEEMRVWVVAHEIGHLLGLGHNIIDERDVMTPVIHQPLARMGFVLHPNECAQILARYAPV